MTFIFTGYGIYSAKAVAATLPLDYDEGMWKALVLSAALLLLGGVTAFWAQSPAQPPAIDPNAINPADVKAPTDPSVWVCPMDPDVRSSQPGNCPRCGMKLSDHIPDAVEYHLDISATPRVPNVGQKTDIRFDVHDPWK